LSFRSAAGADNLLFGGSVGAAGADNLLFGGSVGAAG